MQAHEVHRAAEQQYREITRLSQLNRHAERVASRVTAAMVVEGARWRLALGRSLIRLGSRLAAGTPTTQARRLLP